ncbi:molecular chaperone DnaJ [Rhabdochromatium marinum]|uniref:molecular chaperone DnaJ n=1 Tax=Rhabdochromatium marinum TaxID=48729 RepID=UPI001906F6E6|nr:molecular chaperone DnaJ [Rhabdochromatium marinum]MBK1650422.1 molecular chaperone DnaJ [Rhabdochromatium marinum]
MARLLVLVVLLGLLLWGLHWLRTRPIPEVKRILRRVLLWGGLGVLLVAVASGRLSLLFAVAAAAVPMLLRLLHLLSLLPLIQQALQALGFKTAGANAGQTSRQAGQSRIRTRYLRIALDLRSGHMEGRVLDGPFKGESLAALERSQLQRMLEFYQDSDAQSAAVLRAYLERRFSGASQGSQHDSGRAGAGKAAPTSGRLSLEEAGAILGLSPGADPAAIRDAHRRLMQKLHPDRGGSDYLAAKINAAKQRLLEEFS